MAYTKTAWIARQGTNLNKFVKSEETVTSVVLTNSPDAVSVPGTPFSAENMNNLEDGVFRAHTLLDQLNALIDSRYGEIRDLAFPATALELATMRLLPLKGQVVTIATYQRLCSRMYVGDSLNATADWWYKISNPNDITSRSVSGAYMVVADYRGLFTRGAGTNSKYKTANDTPYDGGEVGSFEEDKVGPHEHGANSQADWEYIPQGDYYGFNPGRGTTQSIIGRHGNETAPASIAVYTCIFY